MNLYDQPIDDEPVQRALAGLAGEAGLVVGLVLAEHLLSMEYSAKNIEHILSIKMKAPKYIEIFSSLNGKSIYL
jgi:hypothetical protein